MAVAAAANSNMITAFSADRLSGLERLLLPNTLHTLLFSLLRNS
uniref:Uncharacterized protein n=1 Tax=Anguilla anguilla TaxID=7936 RepID=A0A0E9PFI6_ANGAN